MEVAKVKRSFYVKYSREIRSQAVELYASGLGYGCIAIELNKKFNVLPDQSLIYRWVRNSGVHVPKRVGFNSYRPTTKTHELRVFLEETLNTANLVKKFKLTNQQVNFVKKRYVEAMHLSRISKRKRPYRKV